MLVSIIIPFYNAGAYALRIVTTISCQTYDKIEVVIVDDGCGRGVQELKDAICEIDFRYPVIWRSTSGRTGPGNARNLGIDACTGDIIAFLDCDDYWAPEYIQAMVELMNIGSSGLVACSSLYFADTEVGERIMTAVYLAGTFSEKQLFQTNPFNPSAVMIRRSSLGCLRFSTCGHEDLDLWIQVASRNGPFNCLGMRLVYVARSEGSRSSNKMRATLWQWLVIKKWCKQSLFKRVIYFMIYGVNAVMKRVLPRYRPLTISTRWL